MWGASATPQALTKARPCNPAAPGLRRKQGEHSPGPERGAAARGRGRGGGCGSRARPPASPCRPCLDLRLDPRRLLHQPQVGGLPRGWVVGWGGVGVCKSVSVACEQIVVVCVYVCVWGGGRAGGPMYRQDGAPMYTHDVHARSTHQPHTNHTPATHQPHTNRTCRGKFEVSFLAPGPAGGPWSIALAGPKGAGFTLRSSDITAVVVGCRGLAGLALVCRFVGCPFFVVSVFPSRAQCRPSPPSWWVC